jgi:pimeloyl-ACP methyl ester carboxylesterase
MIPKLFGKSSLQSRPDLVGAARHMMMQMSPQDIAQVQQGMAERPDSVPALKTIDVPTLLVMGDEDLLATVSDGELMRANIAGSQLRVVAKAGHYAPWEQPEEVGRQLRLFVDSLHGG